MRTEKKLRKVRDHSGLVPSQTASFLMQLEDEYVAYMVDEILSSTTSQQDRTELLCRLLGTFGVGTIVEGRIV